jgi:hypothetical protein
MSGLRESRHLLDFLWSELQSRDVVARDSPASWGSSFNWSLRRDEYGLVVEFPPERFKDVAAWIEAILGPAKFDCDRGPGHTTIHRNETACITIMLTSNPAQLILLDWKDPRIREKMVAKRDAAMMKELDSAVRHACEVVQQAVDSVGTPGEDAEWQEATMKLDDLGATIRVIVSDDEVMNAEEN